MKSSAIKQINEHPEVIANRYRVVSVVGRGGMAIVYKVHDSATSRDMALKLLIERASQNQQDKAVELFEREYFNLMLLAHPRVIEVYDYGIEGSRPYYTMELLDGGDLRTLSLIHWRKACELLMDVCSALSLLHSRKLVHRDVSPHNIRCTNDGLAKLIDFGAMIPMGPCKQVVGTPPFAAPEVVNLQVLDGRADLYSLGATLYYTLTGENAFPARDFKSLRQCWWREPTSPAELVEDIPQALSDLVMALLQIDATLRPANAAEVMERLSVIAQIELNEHLLVSQAYLTTPTLVARKKQLKRVRKHLIRAQRDRGNTVVIHGKRGTGRSRFIDACVLEGKLLGSTVLRADASDARSGDYGIIRALCKQLLAAATEEAQSTASERIGVLGHVLPELLVQFENITLKPFESDFELRPQVQNQFIEWLFDICKKRSILIAIDDIHQVDEPSAALIALLSHRLTSQALALIVSTESEILNSSNGALMLLSEIGTKIRLKDLDTEKTEELLASVFGQVAQIKTLAYQLNKTAEGNPRDILQLAQHLVDRGIVSYQSGTWVIADKIETSDLPRDMAQTFRERIDALNDEARKLAQAMAFASEQDFSLEECRHLSDSDRSRVLLALDTLVAVDILRFDGERYSISHPGWVAVLTASCNAQRQQEIHLGLSAIFESRDQQEFLLARHLFRAGESERALNVLIAFSKASQEKTDTDPSAYYKLLGTLPLDWFDLYNEAIDIARKHNRPHNDIYAMQSRVSGTVATTGSGTAIDWKTILERFYRDCGLGFYHDLDPDMEPSARLKRALALAQERYEQTVEEQRLFDPITSIRFLSRTIIEMCAEIGMTYDYRLWRSLPSLEPLAALSPAIRIVEKLVQGIGHRIVGRSERTIQIYQEILDRIAQADRAGLEESYYDTTRIAVLRAKGFLEASMGLESALKASTELKKEPVYEINSLQIQMLYHLWRGDSTKAQTCRQNQELLRIQKNQPILHAGSNLSREFLAHSLIDDLTGVKPMVERIEKMALQYPTWVPIHYFAVGEYNRIRGDYKSALEELNRAREMTVAGECPNWSEINGAYLNTLLEIGQTEQARKVGQEALDQADQAELGYVRNYIKMPIAIAHAKLGEYESAVEISQAVIDEFESLGALGINLGLAYETRTRVAIMMNDRSMFDKYIEKVAEQFYDKENTALSVRYEKLVRDAQELLRRSSSVENRIAYLDVSPSKRPVARKVSEVLFKHKGEKQRAHRILEMLIEKSNTSEGFLYFMKREGPRLCARIGVQPPPTGLDTTVKNFVAAELSETLYTTLSGSEASSMAETTSSWSEYDGAEFRPLLLGHYVEAGFAVTGVAILLLNPSRKFTYPANLIFAISRFIYESGDVAIHIAAG